MAQTETDQERQQREQQEQQQYQQFQQYQQAAQSAQSQWPQAHFDSVFTEQITQSGIDTTGKEAWQAYFNLVEQTIRTSRQVTDLYLLQMQTQQIVSKVIAQVTPRVMAQVVPQVISAIQSNPSLLKQPVQQVAREMQLTNK